MNRLKPPNLEQAIGIECYKTNIEGIGGRIKQSIEDFIVEEITPEGIALEIGKESELNLSQKPGMFVHCTLEKRNWDSMRAVKEIARRLGISQRRVGYAGTKDKRAVSTQRISIGGVSMQDVEKLSIKDLILRDFSYSDDDIGLGNLAGNRFSITVRGIDLSIEEVESRVESISKNIAAGFPNFFGIQRFGAIRPITHLVGREILRGDFEAAVFVYLAKVFEGENDESTEARRILSETRDVKEALKNFPKNLGYEISMLNHLSGKPDDYRGALRALPEGLSKMFVHAYQSYIFNKSLSRYIEKDIVVERLPLVGFESHADEFTEKILAEEEVKIEDFKVKEFSQLSSKGELRDCFESMENFKVIEIKKDELNEGKNKVSLNFSLKPGVYATTLLREYMKNQYWL